MTGDSTKLLGLTQTSTLKELAGTMDDVVPTWSDALLVASWKSIELSSLGVYRTCTIPAAPSAPA
jgi:hypothetical protein